MTTVIELAERLEALAQRLDLPVAVDVAAITRSAIDAREARAGHRQRWVLVPIVALALLLVFPGPRHTLARWFGLRSTRIEVPSTGPSNAPTDGGPTSAPATFPATTLPTSPQIGADLTAAAHEVGLPAPVPSLLGSPQHVSVVHPPAAGQIVLEYAPSHLLPPSPIPSVGAIVSTFRAQVDGGIFQKVLGPGTTVEEVSIDGTTGYWLAGAPHTYGFVAPDGTFAFDTLRLATNTLIWELNGVTYRLEASVDKATALRIAASIAT